jgi:hypothetical protein
VDRIETTNGLDVFLSNPTPATEASPEPDPIEADSAPAATEPEPSGGDQTSTDAPAEPAAAPVVAPVVDQNTQKNNAAFAAMRAQNAKLERTMRDIAAAINIDANSTDDLLQKLSVMAAEKLAGGVPVEMYMEHTQMKEKLAVIEQENHNAEVFKQFNDISVKYKLTEQELFDFANSLEAQGVKPFEQRGVNLNALFFSMNAESIIEKRTKAAVEEALRKDAAANRTASTPQGSQGRGPSSDQTTINSTVGLDAFLDGK